MKLKCDELNSRQKAFKIDAEHAPEKHLYQAALKELKQKEIEMEDMKSTAQDISDWFPNFKHYGSSVLKKYLKMNAVGKVFVPIAQNATVSGQQKRAPPVPLQSAVPVPMEDALPQDFLVWDLKVCRSTVYALPSSQGILMIVFAV